MMLRFSSSLLLRRHPQPQAAHLRRLFSSSGVLPNDATDCGGKFDIVLCGTDRFACAVLSGLLSRPDLCRSIKVLTPSDAPNKWDSRKRVTQVPLRKLAKSSGLTYFVLPREVPLSAWTLPENLFPSSPSKSSSEDGSGNNDKGRNMLLTASFGHLIPPSILSLYAPSHRLNVHPSLLPQLRGAAPVQWAIANRLQRTGVSIQSLEEQIDTGRIFAQEYFEVDSEPAPPTYEKLLAQVEPIAVALLLDVLTNLETCAAKSIAQSDLGIEPTRAPKVKREHTEIKWPEWTAEEIEARSRAFSYLYPLSTALGDWKLRAKAHRVIFREVIVLPRDDGGERLAPGLSRMSRDGQYLEVGCVGDHHLGVSRLQTENKREMAAKDWIIGYRDRTDPRTGLLPFRKKRK